MMYVPAFAHGSIAPSSQTVVHGDAIAARYNAAYVPITDTIVASCIDGRLATTNAPLLPNSAGGSESIMVADDLTLQRFARATTAEQYESVLQYLVSHRYPIGSHTDDHEHAGASGCGANDKLPSIYAMICQHSNQLRDTISQLGITVSDEWFAAMVQRARARQHFSSGDELLRKAQSVDESAVTVLSGEHREMAVVVNTVPYTTLDRQKLYDRDGAAVFNVDVWAFPATAAILTHDESERQAICFALALYNVATACVLCASSMRMAIR